VCLSKGLNDIGHDIRHDMGSVHKADNGMWGGSQKLVLTREVLLRTNGHGLALSLGAVVECLCTQADVR
jgi:hypothetical protein